MQKMSENESEAMNHEEFLKQVKAKAENARPGKWEYKEFDEYTIEESCHGVICTDDFHIGNGFGKKDGEFVEACCPQAVLKLLAIIEKLKEQQKHLAKIVADPIGGNWGGLLQELYKELDEIVGQP